MTIKPPFGWLAKVAIASLISVVALSRTLAGVTSTGVT
jgi:hypothetical protein